MTDKELIGYRLPPEVQAELEQLEDRPEHLPSQTETVKGNGWKIEIHPEDQLVSVLDGWDSITLTADKLVPLVLALLKLIFENKWYGDA